MSNPAAGEAIASRCVFVIREIRTPLVVELISRIEDAFGVVVPMPAAPVEGKVFCERLFPERITMADSVSKNSFMGFKFFRTKADMTLSTFQERMSNWW